MKIKVICKINNFWLWMILAKVQILIGVYYLNKLELWENRYKYILNFTFLLILLNNNNKIKIFMNRSNSIRIMNRYRIKI